MLASDNLGLGVTRTSVIFYKFKLQKEQSELKIHAYLVDGKEKEGKTGTIMTKVSFH